MKLHKGLLCVFFALILGTLGLASALAAAPNGNPDRGANQNAYRNELPLGDPRLKETRTPETVAPGLTYTRIERGRTSERDYYTVDVSFEATLAEAEELAEELRDDGYDPRIEKVSARAPDDPARGPSGYLVRVGRFETQAEADARRTELVAQGYARSRTVYTGEDGKKTTGPWVVHVLRLDPGPYAGSVAPELATGIVPGRELLTDISARTGAEAAINGGYFVIGENNGTDGDLAGISVLEGDLVSEAVDGRTSLILPEGDGSGSDVAALSDAITATSSDGTSRIVDGRNRKPGLIRGCGGEGSDEPTAKPKHDFTCTDGSELIHFTPDFGSNTQPPDPPPPNSDPVGCTEVALGPDGTVTSPPRPCGGPILPDGSVLMGTLGAADWLREHAEVGETVRVGESVRGGGRLLGNGTGVVNGGPRLLSGGRNDIDAYREGFVYPENPEFYYRFGERRNPRTIAGVTRGGDLLLVAIDGRQPTYSVGASFIEEARVMDALGAREAVNLDGGGSTGMTVEQRLVTQPSDATGERPIGDAVVVLP